METAKREMTFLLADRERRLLRAMASRMPASVRSNHLSGLGVVAAVGAGVAYALSSLDVRWLFGASLMLAVNWFGDSLDGTLARVRGAERPRYGYYLDHVIDGFSTAVIGVGIGLSPYVNMEVALVLVVIYLMLSINVYLESTVYGVFRMAYGKLGPSEARIIMILANTLLAMSTTPRWWISITVVSNTAAMLLGVTMFVILTARFGKNLHRLARMEPQRGLGQGDVSSA